MLVLTRKKRESVAVGCRRRWRAHAHRDRARNRQRQGEAGLPRRSRVPVHRSELWERIRPRVPPDEPSDAATPTA